AFAPNSAGHKRVIEAVQKDKALDDEARRLIIEDMAAHPEEIRAYGFQYFWDGKLKSPKWLTRIWDTVKEFLERVNNGLRGKGFVSAFDVMRSVKSGTLAKTGKARIMGAEK